MKEMEIPAGRDLEDRVVMYMTPKPYGGFADELFAGFRTQYPGVETEYLHEPPARFIERVLLEKEQGKNDGDIMLLSGQMMEVLKIRGYIDPYVSPESGTFPERTKDLDGYGTQLWTVPFSIAYNTEKVGPDELPRRYEDLLDPKWKGKLLYPDPRSSGSGQPWYTVMKEYLGEEFFRCLAEQELCCQYTHPEENLPDGNYSILVTAIVGLIEKMKSERKPVDWIPMPIMQTGGPFAVLFRNAKHPQLGRCLIDFLLSEEGQRIISKHHVPNRPGVQIQSKVIERVVERLKGVQLVSLKPIYGREYHKHKEAAVKLFLGK